MSIDGWPWGFNYNENFPVPVHIRNIADNLTRHLDRSDFNSEILHTRIAKFHFKSVKHLKSFFEVRNESAESDCCKLPLNDPEVNKQEVTASLTAVEESVDTVVVAVLWELDGIFFQQKKNQK